MFRSALVASALIVTAIPQTPSPPSGQQLPTFRTGVDIVEVDVTVLDKNRQPVKGLTADDFTILERGKPQPIVAFSAIDVPALTSYSAAWMRDAPLDVVSNSQNGRIVTIVMDDAYTGQSPAITKRAKDIARAAIAQLGPRDLASVLFTLTGRAQNFTADRSALLRAVDSFVPKLTAGGVPGSCDFKLRSCDIETMSTAAETLLTAPPGRKMLILVSSGRRFAFGHIGAGGVPSSAGHRNEGAGLVAAFDALQRGNVAIYAFGAEGLHTGGMPSRGGATVAPFSLPVADLSADDSLHSFAESTGGRAFTNTNDPTTEVEAAFRESSTYYFVGFRSTAASDHPEFRKIEVKLSRPGYTVRTRNGYYSPGRASRPVDVINGLPGGDLAVRATASVFALPGTPTAEVIVTAGIDNSETALDKTIDLTATVVDLDGKPSGTQHQSITLGTDSATAPDLRVHLSLKPGRYLAQLLIQAGGRSGIVVTDVEVPDFARDPLSVSSLIVRRKPVPPVADKSIADIVPFPPSTLREFRSTDDVTAFVRVYQGSNGRIVPVRMSARIKNDKNTVVSNYEAMLDAADFSSVRSADYGMPLSLEHLSAGQFLLEMDAQSGTRHVTRTARFSVVK